MNHQSAHPSARSFCLVAVLNAAFGIADFAVKQPDSTLSQHQPLYNDAVTSTSGVKHLGPLLAKGLACMRRVIPEASFTCCLLMLQQLLYMHPALTYFALCKIHSKQHLKMFPEDNKSFGNNFDHQSKDKARSTTTVCVQRSVRDCIRQK